MSFTLAKTPVITSSRKPLYNAQVVKADSVFAHFKVNGDTTGAVISITGRLRDDPFKTTVFSKTSATQSEIIIEQTGGEFFSDCTLHIASADTAGLDPDTWIEYDIQVVDDVQYGGTSGQEVTITGATFTIGKGQFKVVDQITV